MFRRINSINFKACFWVWRIINRKILRHISKSKSEEWRMIFSSKEGTKPVFIWGEINRKVQEQVCEILEELAMKLIFEEINETRSSDELSQ